MFVRSFTPFPLCPEHFQCRVEKGILDQHGRVAQWRQECLWGITFQPPPKNLCWTLYHNKKKLFNLFLCSPLYTGIPTDLTSTPRSPLNQTLLLAHYYCSFGNHQTQTHPLDCQMEKCDMSLQRAHLNHSTVQWHQTLYHSILNFGTVVIAHWIGTIQIKLNYIYI